MEKQTLRDVFHVSLMYNQYRSNVHHVQHCDHEVHSHKCSVLLACVHALAHTSSISAHAVCAVTAKVGHQCICMMQWVDCVWAAAASVACLCMCVRGVIGVLRDETRAMRSAVEAGMGSFTGRPYVAVG